MNPAVCALLLVISAPVTTKVATPTLIELCDVSPRIVIGRVERIVAVPNPRAPKTREGDFEWELEGLHDVQVAELTVERTLKGPAASKRVRFLAMSTWTCDVSSAKVGERLLVFLSPWEKFDVWTSARGKRPADLSDDDRVWQIAWSGRGRMECHQLADAREMIEVFDVHMPKSVPPQGSERYGAEPLLDFVRTAARFDPATLALHLGARGKRPEFDPRRRGFDWRVLPDGAFRLSIGPMGDDTVKLGELDGASLRRLSETLALTPADRCQGEIGQGAQRWLSVLLPDLRFRAELGQLEGTEQEVAATQFMNLWTLCRRALDCTECLGEGV